MIKARIKKDRLKISRFKIEGNSRIAILVSVSAFVLLMFFSIIFIYNFSMRIREDEANRVAISYYSLNEEIRDFKNQNVSLLSGFAAYIQLKETTSDEEIYEYLGFLLRDHLDDIKNIGVLIDTTIRWVYPTGGNEGAIGKDLTEIPEQRDEVLRVKNNLETLFVGPVNLIQGGTAFIIRMPLLKDEAYWGMVSIVLKAENAFKFVDKHSRNYKIDYLITPADTPNEIIYGNSRVLELSPLKFRTEASIGNWDVYAVPSGGWDHRVKQIALIFFACILMSFFVSLSTYSWIKKYGKVLNDKVELEGKYIQDRFTKIYTREYFNLRLKEEVSNSQRHNHPISMIYFDLDHFKKVNDVHGHSAGDEVLLEVVAKVKSIIRLGDIFARWGGDEFIILLPNINLSGAQAIAERIRREIEALDINKSYGVTASVGYSEWKNKEYIESWFIRTDQALYTSKNTGKNKITASDHNKEKNILVRAEWDETSNSGCKTIDDEHRAIVARCNRIVESALEQSSFDETIRNVENVILEMEQHFKDEIEILNRVGYPQVEKHKKIHAALLSRTNVIFKKTIQRDITAVEFFSFLLITVVEGHFKNEDVKYFPYIAKEKNNSDHYA
ncbi:diguanylate cyclase domain-containing protein [Fusibacter ferrireducens]|uniref:Diguanylate cyclase n=1 Tax=Fusibacter ferrireducens TaxID=2785058 RepID=A0ABR9ZY95_9FIRM|nr:diguanylate cyclase [Fusibacter ferrireducens]MBF4694936.1 diguanylate cyclase [Fusibacter ferrireducens]